MKKSEKVKKRVIFLSEIVCISKIVSNFAPFLIAKKLFYYFKF